MIRRVKLLTLSLFILSLAAGSMAACSRAGAPAPTATPAPERPELILATTTSTMDSGLLDVLIPAFEKQTGYQVKPIAVGTGQALAMGERGEADVLLVHAPDAEKAVVDKGAAINRLLVMHNDFVIVGPPADPAGIAGRPSVVETFKQLAAKGAVFVSRGDDSGTDKMEKSLWKKAGVQPAGSWYVRAGAGMGQTLRIASEKAGYTLTDRATYLANQSTLQLKIVLEKDPVLLNIYHVMQVNPAKFPKVNSAGAKAFSDFLRSEGGQQLISQFGVAKFGSPLFFPDAGKSDADLAK